MAYVIAEPFIDGGPCEQACPHQAIFRAEELPQAWAGFAWVDATWYADPGRAGTAVSEYLPAA